jgi:hypothetical protein
MTILVVLRPISLFLGGLGLFEHSAEEEVMHEP